MSKAMLVDEDVLKSSIRAVLEEMVDDFWVKRITRRDAANLNLGEGMSQMAILSQAPEPQSMNDRELKSIYALFSWVAEQQDAAEETVRSITEARFNVDDVVCVPRKDYDEVIRFLVDLRIDDIRN